MTKMSELHITICEMLESTLYSDLEIAEALQIPVEWVAITRAEFDEDYTMDQIP